MVNVKTRATGSGVRWAVSLAAAGTIMASAAVGGCGDSRDPNRQLSNEEGEALLESIRANPPRPDDLTIAEKKWLLKRMGR